MRGINLDHIETHEQAVQAILVLAERHNVGVAYVDRMTVEAHVERKLDDSEWERIDLTGYEMYVSCADDFQAEFINGELNDAGVQGYVVSWLADIEEVSE